MRFGDIPETETYHHEMFIISSLAWYVQLLLLLQTKERLRVLIKSLRDTQETEAILITYLLFINNFFKIDIIFFRNERLNTLSLDDVPRTKNQYIRRFQRQHSPKKSANG